MRPSAEQRRRLVAAGAAAGCALLAGAVAQARAPHRAARSAQASPPAAAVVVPAPRAPPGGLDPPRVQLGRADDGRLRAALTLATAWRMSDLPADDGPPGSLCLRMWTDAKPPRTFPDRLLCMAADADGRHMRGEVFGERGGALVRVANATLARSSDRTVVARFSQSAIGRPARVRFAAEATAPGCDRPACVDTAPNAPTVATLDLRSR